MTKKKSNTQPLKIGNHIEVRVRLTEFGWGLYENYFPKSIRPKTIKGYISMPLATLMNIFGRQLNTLEYDERFSVFIDNEIIYDIPNSKVIELAQNVEIDWYNAQNKC